VTALFIDSGNQPLGRTVEAFESIAGEPLQGSGFELEPAA